MTFSRPAARLAVDDQGSVSTPSPFALNAEKSWGQVEDEVVTAALANRAVNLDPEPSSGQCYRLLGDSLLVGGEHRRT